MTLYECPNCGKIMFALFDKITMTRDSVHGCVCGYIQYGLLNLKELEEK